MNVGSTYQRLLADTAVRERFVTVASGRVHLLDGGEGPPVVLLHGTGNSAGFLLPLLCELKAVHAFAPDLPGIGLSDPAGLATRAYRRMAVAWLDRLLDALGLDTIALGGHSGGGMWAAWYALARPDRVRRLVLIGVPGLPHTRCPLPLRLIATPALGRVLSRFPPPSRAAISPFALLTPTGWRRGARLRPAELRSLTAPTLVVWGDREPLGGPAAARAIADLIPHAELEILPAGHGPLLGQPKEVAQMISDFVT